MITVAHPNFSPQRKAVIVHSLGITEVDLMIEISPVSERLTVTAEAGLAAWESQQK